MLGCILWRDVSSGPDPEWFFSGSDRIQVHNTAFSPRYFVKSFSLVCLYTFHIIFIFIFLQSPKKKILSSFLCSEREVEYGIIFLHVDLALVLSQVDLRGGGLLPGDDGGDVPEALCRGAPRQHRQQVATIIFPSFQAVLRIRDVYPGSWI